MKKVPLVLFVVVLLAIVLGTAGNPDYEPRQPSIVTIAPPESLNSRIGALLINYDDCYPEYCVRLTGTPGDTNGVRLMKAFTKMKIVRFSTEIRGGQIVIKELMLSMDPEGMRERPRGK